MLDFIGQNDHGFRLPKPGVASSILAGGNEKALKFCTFVDSGLFCFQQIPTFCSIFSIPNSISIAFNTLNNLFGSIQW